MATYRFHWSTELYGHGRWLRAWLGWPEWLPFPAYCDHGVSHDSDHAPHELQNEFRIHLFWSDYKSRYAAQRSPWDRRRYIQAPHPYLYLRLRRFRMPNPNRQGLLVFWPHGTPLYKYPSSYVENYIAFLESIRPNYGSMKICLAWNDRAEPWVSLLKERFEVVTAGDSMAPEFAERLLALINQHEVATSPTAGSQVHYCTMMGVHYFIDGPVPTYTNLGDPNIPAGRGENRSMRFNALQETVVELYAAEHLSRWTKKVELTERLLGVSANPSRFSIKVELLLELFRLSLFTSHGIKMLAYFIRQGLRSIPVKKADSSQGT